MKKFFYLGIFSFVGVLSLNFTNLHVVPCVEAAEITQGWRQGMASVSNARTGLPETKAKNVIINIVKWLLGLVFWLAVLAFVGSGLMFIVSFGNASIHSMAKDWLMFAIIGLVVSVLGYVIIISVSNILLGKNIRGMGGGGVGGSITVDQNGVWGEATIPVGNNGDITIDNNGVSGDIRLPWR